MKQPLFDMEFMIVGETSKPKVEIENKIKQMGGKLCMEFHGSLTAIISNAAEVTKMGLTMTDAKTHGIHVVPETFVDEVKHSDPLQSIAKFDLGGWGENVRSFLEIIDHLIYFFYSDFFFICTTMVLCYFFVFSLTKHLHLSLIHI